MTRFLIFALCTKQKTVNKAAAVLSSTLQTNWPKERKIMPDHKANAPAGEKAQPEYPYGKRGCQVEWGGINHSGPAKVKVRDLDKTVFQICQAHLDYILIQQIGQPEGKGNYWTVIENLPAAPPAPEGQRTIGGFPLIANR